MTIEKTVFVITYGRSGSTLLQGVLDSMPGYDVKGENYSTLVPLFRSYKRSRVTRYKFGKEHCNSQNPWYGSDEVVPDAYAKSLCDVFISEILRPKKDTRVTGFKEIRYGGTEFPDCEEAIEYLEFLKKFFPDARFIFNERDLAATAKSAWWAKNPGASDALKDLLLRMEKMYEAHRGNSVWVKYDEYVKDLSKLKPLFEFLGETFSEERLKMVLSQKHSY